MPHTAVVPEQVCLQQPFELSETEDTKIMHSLGGTLHNETALESQKRHNGAGCMFMINV